MSSPLQIAILLLALGGVSFVSGQDNSGCLEHIDNFKQTVFEDHVYYISTDRKHWIDAKKACEELRGKLAVLDNDTALEHVRNVLKANIRGENKKFWVGLQWNSNANGYQWLSGQSHVHKNNPSWQGADADYVGGYVAMVPPGFLFNNNIDYNNYYYVCEKERTVWPIGRHDGKDFYVANKMMDWSEGRRFCQACKDARLAEIRDEGTERFLRTNFTDTLIDPRLQVYWMGLQGNLSGSDSVTWMWSTGEEIICNLSPAPFPCQRISNAFLGDFGWKCIHISTSPFQWVGDNCTTERGVLCEQVQDILRPESSTNAEVTSSETGTTETDSTSTAISSTPTVYSTTDEGVKDTNNSQFTESPVSYAVPIAVVAVCIILAALLVSYFVKKRRRGDSIKDADAELAGVTRHGLPRAEMQFSNSTYGEPPPLSSEENPEPDYTSVPGGSSQTVGGAGGATAVPMVDPLRERGDGDETSGPGAETYDHAFQHRPDAREATRNIYGHLEDANAPETETEMYDHAFNNKAANPHFSGGVELYGHLSVEGEIDSNDPYDSTVQTRSRETTDVGSPYDNIAIDNTEVTSPDTPDAVEPMYINN